MLSVSRPTLYRIIARGTLTAYKVEGSRGNRFKLEDIERLRVPVEKPAKGR